MEKLIFTFVIAIAVLKYLQLPMRKKCRKSTESKNLKIVKTKNPGRLMVFSNCAVCCLKKLKLIKEQEASRLLSSLGTKTPFIKFPIVDPIL